MSAAVTYIHYKNMLGHARQLERELLTATKGIEALREGLTAVTVDRDQWKQMAVELGDAGNKLNPWCIATHGHIPLGWDKFKETLGKFNAMITKQEP
jgi:hypothetical protein